MSPVHPELHAAAQGILRVSKIAEIRVLIRSKPKRQNDKLEAGDEDGTEGGDAREAQRPVAATFFWEIRHRRAR